MEVKKEGRSFDVMERYDMYFHDDDRLCSACTHIF